MKIKHTLLAASLLAAMSAQAQTAFTVYGNADIALNNDVKTATSGIKSEETSVVPGGLSTSNVGFRGEREIAQGLKAVIPTPRRRLPPLELQLRFYRYEEVRQ